MTHNALSCLATLLCSTVAFAQPGGLHPLTTLATEHPITNVSVDRLGNFYFVKANNCIQKRDKNGLLLEEIDFPTQHVSLIEAWNPLRVFIYEKKNQRYILLGPHLTIMETRSLDVLPLSAPPEQVCPDKKNDRVWCFDSTDPALKKINLISLKIETNIPLPATWVNQKGQVGLLREYQNELFLINKKTGIHIFSHIGTPIAQIPIVGLSNFNFIGEELCYLKAGKVWLFDLYTTQERIWKDISPIKKRLFVIGTDERLAVVTDNTLYVIEAAP